MGFTSSFTGGVTLTLGLAYLTVLTHERNRQAQASALRSQSRLLQSLLEPTPIPLPQTRAELAREERSTLVEAAKDRWNDEVENAVRWVQKTNWDEVRENMEGSVARLLGVGHEKSREGVEAAGKNASPIAQQALERSRAAAKDAAEHAAVTIDKTAGGAQRLGLDAKDNLATAKDKAVELAKEKSTLVGERTGEFKDAAKSRTDRAVADAKTGAQSAANSIQRSGGTVDAVRGAVREAVSKGIEKGKEALGKAEEKLESVGSKLIPTSSESSAVEKALHERYQKPDALKKSAEEILAERYKPIDSRDNTVLRGV
ncbi:hypothetical protein BJ875DRAFT_16283 [Amylocarpus encephaloides]|uniref:MICOS complex subunit MIC12 n=1 Tax=Amylocarpus encephaloides TaxID=45428 RepID=A0A9P8C5P1_9HELO|nr:hypothetical protein BJ875DRAFT_16283 [Amylocarpus encephaloides]